MKKLLMVLVILFASALPGEADANIIREAGRGCLAGGSVFAATTYLGMTPALLSTVAAVPGYSILINNAVLGCGIFAVGFAAGSVWAGLWDLIF